MIIWIIGLVFIISIIVIVYFKKGKRVEKYTDEIYSDLQNILKREEKVFQEDFVKNLNQTIEDNTQKVEQNLNTLKDVYGQNIIRAEQSTNDMLNDFAQYKMDVLSSAENIDNVVTNVLTDSFQKSNKENEMFYDSIRNKFQTAIGNYNVLKTDYTTCQSAYNRAVNNLTKKYNEEIEKINIRAQELQNQKDLIEKANTGEIDKAINDLRRNTESLISEINNNKQKTIQEIISKTQAFIKKNEETKQKLIDAKLQALKSINDKSASDNSNLQAKIDECKAKIEQATVENTKAIKLAKENAFKVKETFETEMMQKEVNIKKEFEQNVLNCKKRLQEAITKKDSEINKAINKAKQDEIKLNEDIVKEISDRTARTEKELKDCNTRLQR